MGVPFSQPHVFRRLRPTFGKGADNATTRDYETPTVNDTVRGRYQPSDGRVLIDETGQNYSQDALWFTTRPGLQRDDAILVDLPGTREIFSVQSFNAEYDVRGRLSHYLASLAKRQSFPDFPEATP